MASITRNGEKWRARVRISGVAKSGTFRTKAEATAWASMAEQKIQSQNDIKNSFSIHPQNTSILPPNKIIELSNPVCNASGVYFLINGGAIEYIGKSKNVLGRILGHSEKGRKFDRFTFIPCNECDLDETEKKYIDAYRQDGNKTAK